MGKKQTLQEKQTIGGRIEPLDFQRTATRVSMVSIFGNLILSIFKAMAGVIANSGAMISDAVHSASDVFSSIIVIIGVKLSAKASDEKHPYGHERFECVAAIILAVILLITGLFIGHTTLESLSMGKRENITIPGNLALLAAVISIITKEAMFWYTRYFAKKLDSGALMADAWHHRSDALSSIGALVGIIGSRLGYPIFDPIASLVICLFIVKASYDIFVDAIKKMVDHSCSKKMEEDIKTCVLEQDGVLGIDLLQTREFGNMIYVDMEIKSDGNITLFASHEIAENVHKIIEHKFPKVKHIMIHTNPV